MKQFRLVKSIYYKSYYKLQRRYWFGWVTVRSLCTEGEAERYVELANGGGIVKEWS